MKKIGHKLLFLGIALAFGGIETFAQNNTMNLPEPYATPSVTNISKVIGWPDGKTPIAPAGFRVTEFARDFRNPRWIYVSPGGDVFVSDVSSGAVYLFRDTDHNGTYKTRHTYLTGLNRPFGMLVLDGHFYVANTDALVRFPYNPNNTEITTAGEKILSLPAGGNHWTRNIIANREGNKIYVSVGSSSNDGERGMDREARRACILEINPDGSGEIVYASGLRNPVGMDLNPANGELWTAVNERDGYGDELPPDYATHVRRGGFYGWPYAYFGAHEDPVMKGVRPDLVAKTIAPDVPLGAHTASLGLVFYTAGLFPEKYRNGMFIGQHGSWNRSKLSGYKVVFIPFRNGKPSGGMEDFLTGFIANQDKSEVYGRPVCTAVLPDGSLLVTDDASKVIWRVSVDK